MQIGTFHQNGYNHESGSSAPIILRSIVGLFREFQMDMLTSALKHGHDVNAPVDDNGQTILTFLTAGEVRRRREKAPLPPEHAKRDHEELLQIFKFLLNAGADPNGLPSNHASTNAIGDDQHIILRAPTPVSILLSYENRSLQISEYVELFLSYGAVLPEPTTT